MNSQLSIKRNKIKLNLLNTASFYLAILGNTKNHYEEESVLFLAESRGDEKEIAQRGNILL